MSARTLTLSLGLAAAAFTVCGCTTTQHRNAMAESAAMDGSTRFCPETSQPYRLYRYFPDNEVYQSVYHYRWFWQKGDQYFSSQSLPESVAVNENFYVLIELPTTRPFTQHTIVAAQYPSTDSLMALNEVLGDEMMAENSSQMNAGRSVYVSAPTDQ